MNSEKAVYKPFDTTQRLAILKLINGEVFLAWVWTLND